MRRRLRVVIPIDRLAATDLSHPDCRAGRIQISWRLVSRLMTLTCSGPVTVKVPLTEAMRAVASDPPAARERGAVGRERVSERFGSVGTIQSYREALERAFAAIGL